jgi:DNA polymerase I-like protein with 3'-5' exonuclease and polymerase domains
MAKYCERDVQITQKLYHYLLEEGKDFSKQSIELEHRIADIIYNQKTYGFYIDKSKAISLFVNIRKLSKEIEREIQQQFKPRPKFIREVVPKYKQNGEMSRTGVIKYVDKIEDVGGCFSVFEYRDFNLASPKQIIERLNECGWKPKVFTPKGSPKVCEENLETIPDSAPESAKKLAKWKMLETRWKTVEAWLDNIDKNNRVHGEVHTMGAVTGRMTHSNPNMANVVSNDKPYGQECRECWTVPNDDYRIVGMDAKGLELRMLAHYMQDKEYMDVVLNGDPHTINMKASGLTTRADSKRFIYAFLYGAGAEKLGHVVGGNANDGARLKRDFLRNMPSLARLIDKVQRLSEKGFLKGLDGRKIFVRHQHASLNTLLQGAGAISCKQWSVCMDDYIKEHNLKAHLVNTIHDEMQFEVHKNDVDKIIEGADLTMQKAGVILGVRLPLNAEAKVGFNWAETH